MSRPSGDRLAKNHLRKFKVHISCVFNTLVNSVFTILPATSDLRVRGSSPLERATSNTFILKGNLLTLCSLFNHESRGFIVFHIWGPSGDWLGHSIFTNLRTHFESHHERNGGNCGGDNHRYYKKLGQV